MEGPVASREQKRQYVKKVRQLVKAFDLKSRKEDLIFNFEFQDSLFNGEDETSDALHIDDQVFLKKTQNALQQVEDLIESLCNRLESERTEVEERKKKAVNDLEISLSRLVSNLIQLESEKENVELLKERYEKDIVSRTQQASSTDEAFKKLSEEKQLLSQRLSRLMTHIQEMDTKKQADLEQHLQKTLAAAHEGIASSPLLDAFSTDILTPILASSAGTHKSCHSPEISSETESNPEQLREAQLDTFLFCTVPDIVFRRLGPLEPTDLQGIRAVVGQKARQYRVVSALISASQDDQIDSELIRHDPIYSEKQALVKRQDAILEAEAIHSKSTSDESTNTQSCSSPQIKRYAPHKSLFDKPKRQNSNMMDL